jgi:general secretion pathway protein N
MMQRILYLTIAGLVLEAANALAAGGADVAPGAAKRDAGRQANEPAEELTGNPLWGIPLRQLSATRDRPVFSSSRRPPPPAVIPTIAFTPPPVAAKPPEPASPPLDLIGTVIGERERLAVFVEQTTKVLVRLRLDETYQGWIVRSIQHRETTFQRDRMTAVVELPPPSTPTPSWAVPPNKPSAPPVAAAPVAPAVAVRSTAPPSAQTPAPDAASSQGLTALFFGFAPPRQAP